jgi:hypothetical protein
MDAADSEKEAVATKATEGVAKATEGVETDNGSDFASSGKSAEATTETEDAETEDAETDKDSLYTESEKAAVASNETADVETDNGSDAAEKEAVATKRDGADIAGIEAAFNGSKIKLRVNCCWSCSHFLSFNGGGSYNNINQSR